MTNYLTDPTIPDDLRELMRQADEQMRNWHQHVPFHRDMLDGHVVIARHKAGSDGASSLVAIIDADDEACDIRLVQSEVSLASEHDRIIFSDQNNLGFHLVVSNIEGSTFTDDIDAVLDILPISTLDNAPEGMALKGPLDARWDFAISEVARFHRLTYRFLRHLLED